MKQTRCKIAQDSLTEQDSGQDLSSQRRLLELSKQLTQKSGTRQDDEHLNQEEENLFFVHERFLRKDFRQTHR